MDCTSSLAEQAFRARVREWLRANLKITGIMRSGRPGPEGSILKLLWSELERRTMEAATWIPGAYAQLDEHAPQAHDGRRWCAG
jgi:hypothetical protein